MAESNSEQISGRPVTLRTRLGEWTERRSPWLFLSPALFLIIILGIYPLLYAVWISFYRFDPSNMTVLDFVGFGNYIKVLGDWRFWNVMEVTIKFLLIVVPAEFLLGLTFALAFDVESRWLERIRTVLIIPMMIAPVSVGIIWRLMFQSETGILNYFVRLLGGNNVLWLADPKVALWAVALVDIWQWTPLMFLLLLAGLRSVPVDIVEAALVDGANAFQSLIHVRLPTIKSVIHVAVLLRSLDAIRTYDTIYVLTRGGPASATDLYTMYTFRTAFAHFNLDTAAALSIIFFILLTITVPLVFFKILGFKIEV